MNLSDKITYLLTLNPAQAQTTLALLDADNIILLIGRYHKKIDVCPIIQIQIVNMGLERA